MKCPQCKNGTLVVVVGGNTELTCEDCSMSYAVPSVLPIAKVILFNDSIEKARSKGEQASFAGETDNPYTEGSPPYEAWKEGSLRSEQGASDSAALLSAEKEIEDLKEKNRYLFRFYSETQTVLRMLSGTKWKVPSYYRMHIDNLLHAFELKEPGR